MLPHINIVNSLRWKQQCKVTGHFRSSVPTTHSSGTTQPDPWPLKSIWKSKAAISSLFCRIVSHGGRLTESNFKKWASAYATDALCAREKQSR